MPQDQNQTGTELPDLLFDEETDPAQDAVNRLLAGIGSSSNAYCSIWEQDGTHKAPLKFLFKCAPDEYDYEGLIEKVQQDHGGGTYRLQIRVNGKLQANHTFAIAGEKKKAPEAAVKTLLPSGDTDFKSLFLEIQRSNQEMMREILASIPQQGNNLVEMAQQMMVLKQLFGNDAPKESVDPLKQFQTTLAMMNEIKAIGGDGEGGVGSQVVAVVQRYLPEIINVTKLALSRPRAPMMPFPGATARPTQAQPGPTPQPQHKTATVQGEKMNPILTTLRGHIVTLTNFAATGTNPELCASLVIDKTPEEMIDPLCDFLESPDCMKQLIELHPPIANLQPWFEQLRESIIAQLTVDDDTTGLNTDSEFPGAIIEHADTANDASGRSGGNPGDPEDNADGDA